MQQKMKTKDPLRTRSGNIRLGPLNCVSRIEKLIESATSNKEKHRLQTRLVQVQKRGEYTDA